MFLEAALILRIGLLCAGLSSLQSAHMTSQQPPQEAAEIRVVLLGTGTPVPSATQVGASILVEAGGELLLFDCGRGCTTRLAQVDPGLIARVDRLFVTHLHSDHIVGIDDLWLNGWVQGRKEPLAIWGPEGLRHMMTHLRAAYSADIDQRLKEGIPPTAEGIADRFVEIAKSGVVYEENGVTVTAFAVEHVPGEPCYGYKVTYAGRSVVISGDTTLTDNLFTYAQDTDLLLQEVMSPALVDFLDGAFAPEQVSRIVGIHTTAPQAADLFSRTNPRMAIYYHTKNDGEFASSLMRQTAHVYPGRVQVGYDLMEITIGNDISTRKIDAD